MFLVRTLLFVCCLTLSVLAQSKAADNGYAPVELKNVVGQCSELEGRRVAVTAEIVSVSADVRSMSVFDNSSKTIVSVSLDQLSKSQRQSLINQPVLRVSVFGRVEVKNNRAVIKADQVMPLATTLVAKN
ncbi:MAG: hypothetical protein SF097_07995 [Acidobacteriota bacterium]|nr:hypothetical protein [Acidobacteriota bacterium]